MKEKFQIGMGEPANELLSLFDDEGRFVLKLAKPQKELPLYKNEFIRWDKNEIVSKVRDEYKQIKTL